MSESHHAQLLLAILRQRWDAADELVSGMEVSTDMFLDLCRQADVPTWVHAELSLVGRLDLIGPEAAERLRASRTRVRRDNLLLIARAEQALAVLLQAGVVPIALKGLDLLHRVYGSFDERILDDVDLLIRSEQLRTAVGALEAAGWEAPPEPSRSHYIRSSHHLPLRSPGPVAVDFEIHWNLAQDKRYRIDERELWQQAVPLEVGGHRILRLHDHDMVAHLVLHHFTHYFDRRLKWAVDLHAVAGSRDFDWSVVVQRIRSWGATAACGMALVHLQKMFPEWIPASATSGLRVAGWRRLLLRPLRSAHPLDLFRHTRRRWAQLYIAAVLLEQPTRMAGWLAHRALRDRRPGANPLDDAGSS